MIYYLEGKFKCQMYKNKKKNVVVFLLLSDKVDFPLYFSFQFGFYTFLSPKKYVLCLLPTKQSIKPFYLIKLNIFTFQIQSAI